MIQRNVGYRWGQSLGYAAETAALVVVPAGEAQTDSYAAPRAGKLVKCRLGEGQGYVARVPARVLPNSMVLVRLTLPIHLDGHSCDYAYIRNEDLFA